MHESNPEKIIENLGDIDRFCSEYGQFHLRSYQLEVAHAVIASVMGRKGYSFVVVFPRQSGKNELQAQLEAYLMLLHSQEQMEMVKVSPTWKPQSQNAMRRLERTLKQNEVCYKWNKRSGYIYQIGDCMMHFLSGSPTSSIVGATANLLLECDEAQDVQISKWDKEIAPMAASTNATRIFWGTAWTSRTLLARELRAARLAEQVDGFRRNWVLTANEVGVEVPAYRKFIDEQLTRLGRDNPLVRTQYFSEEIDGEGGMFPLGRRLLMIGAHERQQTPVAGQSYAFTIDVAGQDEGVLSFIDFEHGDGSQVRLANPRRDSTVLTIFQIDMNSMADQLALKPTYRVVQRFTWQGVKHSGLYGILMSLVEAWSPVRVIIDSTGVGAGLASFLQNRLGSRLVPFEFNQASKSNLGWDFLTVVETGRYKEYQPMDQEMMRQLEYCQYTVLDGPGKIMRWGVPDSTRETATGELVHDDYIMSAALISLLDQEKWGTADSQVIRQKDIFEEMRF